ncbi:MAG: acyl carrier protein [Bryobacteraceae bacterium]|nr:acyl carrier protein [Bryobacteraceae bacterium]MDW8377401.1 acyl carrier protein [Bryobacterales bacterium]
MSDDITQRVIQVIAKTQHLSPEQIRPTSSFEELNIDSLDGINIVFNLENEFDVSIPDEAAKSIRSVADVVEGIRRLLAEKASGA